MLYDLTKFGAHGLLLPFLIICRLTFLRNSSDLDLALASANMTIATCCLYVEPMMREYIESMVVPEEEVSITYLDQNKPSHYGMPAYEPITEWTAAVLDDPAYSTFHKSIDRSGARVSSYYNGHCLISIVRRCKRMIPYSMEKPFKFSTETHN